MILVRLNKESSHSSVLSSSHAMSSSDWDVLWVASTAVVASESVRLAMSADGGVWSKKGIHAAFGLCLKPLPGPKSSMFSSLLR